MAMTARCERPAILTVDASLPEIMEPQILEPKLFREMAEASRFGGAEGARILTPRLPKCYFAVAGNGGILPMSRMSC